MNRSAVERRAATLRGRRTVKKEWQAAWLLRAVTLIDLTTLVGRRHRRPRPAALRQGAPAGPRPTCSRRWARASSRSGSARSASTTGFVATAVEALRGLGHPGRRGLDRLPGRPLAARAAARRDPRIGGRRRRGDRHRHHPRPRARPATGRRSTTRCAPCARPAATRTSRPSSPPASWARCATSARASLVCMMAGADFIKTSTGKEGVNATLPVSLVMVRAIRDYRERTGYMVGFKPAGGIARPRMRWTGWSLMKEELGDRVAQARPVPLRREQPARRHRAPARALRDRPLLGGAPAPDGVR